MGDAAPAPEVLEYLLRTPRGKDFGALALYLPTWEATGDKAVDVFADRVVGMKGYASVAEAEAAAEALTAAVKAWKARPRDEAREVSGEQQPPAFRTIVIPRYGDDASIRVAWVGEGRDLDLFAPALPIKLLQAEYGKPESVEAIALSTESDERPVILTISRYAGGAFATIEVTPAPRPGFLDRIRLEVAAVRKALVKE